MGKGRPRAVEKGVPGHCPSSSQALALPQAPVYYPSESEFLDPLSFIAKIRPEAEIFGICRIVPPKGWEPPFALDLSSFSFQTKSQAIHRLQSRPAACDPTTFELEYTRFLENHCGRKPKKRAAVVVFEGEDLSLCSLFNAVKRFGGYDKVLKDKRWGDVFRFVRSDDKKKRMPKITECSKHVLCQLYREHLYDYEQYCNGLNSRGSSCDKDRKRKSSGDGAIGSGSCGFKRRRRKNVEIKVEREAELDNSDQICEQCKSGLHGDVMLLCDRCNKGWHLYCLTPPLEKVPPGNWYCLECVNSDKDSFGFVLGKRLSLDAFKKVAEKAKRKWLGASGSISRSAIERKFWDIVEGSLGMVEVMYGSDLDTSLCGSGFPRERDPIPPSVEPDVWKKYCSSPWNLNNLPKLEGSMLQPIHDNIAGVMVPWLYMGMLFSSFCWHFEDHCFYSMNYLHWGEAKCWYSVPGNEAHAFEQVMRKTLPDLFDAQPDLLFQLVTMLNPSVLQEQGVPVYGALQEPGNFIITFPRSYHGGFNFGLNCAEAVNFAPADWLPHGGFGAELYRLYHKAPVLSHEELLCVLAKGSCSSNVLPYLKEEVSRVFMKEKFCREKLWTNGIVKSSLMSPRKQPEYVGTEEDPTCIICQQYLFLSAVVCSCRPSAFVCLEHWEHLCECNPSKHCLLYRQTLAELSDLLCKVTPISVGPSSSEAATKRVNCLSEISSCDQSDALIKKVQGGHASYKQLAEDWISTTRQIFEVPFCDNACINALKEAEQFLWAGHEMDMVRCIVTDLLKAQKWSMDVRNCLSNVETWLHLRNGDRGKVLFTDIVGLLHVDSLPCIEPGYTKLKAFIEDASKLLAEVKSVLSSHTCTTVAALEALYSQTVDLPILLDESGELAREISSAKVWLSNVTEHIVCKKPIAIEVEVLDKLKSEMSQLRVRLPEMDVLLGLLRDIDSWKARCNEFLTRPITLKDLEIFLKNAGDFNVSIPELKLLKKYHSDALSWVSHFEEVIKNIQDREDYDALVKELTGILEAGESLRVCVDQLPLLKEELRKSHCRGKASEALKTKMPLELIKELMEEAAFLHITTEKLFIDISGILEAASSWEDSARRLLGCMGQMSEFEDALRDSEGIFVILPSLRDVKEALSMAESWTRAAQPFLTSAVCSGQAMDPPLKIDSLKELLIQSKLLKVSLKSPEMLQRIVKKVEGWVVNSCSLLERSDTLSNIHDIGLHIANGFSTKIEALINEMDDAIQSGLALGFDFYEIPKLQNASCMLKWSLKALLFCFTSPTIKEVDNLILDIELLPTTYVGCSLVSSLIDGIRWLRQALLAIPEPHSCQRCQLKEAELVLEDAQRIKVPFPEMVDQLANAIEKHKSWLVQVNVFFNSELGKRSWTSLKQLHELGQSDAFNSPELEKVSSEIGRVQKWFMLCKDIVSYSDGDLYSLSSALLKLKDTLDRALCIYHNPRGCSTNAFCICYSNGDQNAVTCMACKNWYHLTCMGPSLANADAMKEYKCPFCLCIESGGVSKNDGRPLMSRRGRPELNVLKDLLFDAKDFYAGIEERDIVQEIMDKALSCKSLSSDIMDKVVSYANEDLSPLYGDLCIVLKAVAVADFYDDENSDKLEFALARSSWKIRVKKTIDGSKKPFIQQIQRLLKEGLILNIPPEDYYKLKLTALKRTGLEWANLAKKVAMDCGAVELEEVFKLIVEGENLPVLFEKELKLLRARSVLYCICRRPYDQRAMIACDQCDEWYHFDCINLREPTPKTYICPACRPLTADIFTLSSPTLHDERSSAEDEPQTPPPRLMEPKRRQAGKCRSSLQQKMRVATDLVSVLKFYGEIDDLWRKNRRPIKRTARRRSKYERLISPLFNQQL